MTNFDFLKQDEQFASFADVVITAKNLTDGYCLQNLQ